MVLGFILGMVCTAAIVCLAMLLSPQPPGPATRVGDSIRIGQTPVTLTDITYDRSGVLRASFESTRSIEARSRIL